MQDSSTHASLPNSSRQPPLAHRQCMVSLIQSNAHLAVRPHSVLRLRTVAKVSTGSAGMQVCKHQVHAIEITRAAVPLEPAYACTLGCVHLTKGLVSSSSLTVVGTVGWPCYTQKKAAISCTQ
eukprot:TRINITY_DN8363_c0_g1_i1.p1 TRINITY_DN8363_c0_g1~~TRINITY_DN8363_c0_g1_i1.p1  ORF type:complete len:123 (-),score=4.19 TRINITY_DN8363_c0_g1_i1:529-897(-)